MTRKPKPDAMGKVIMTQEQAVAATKKAFPWAKTIDAREVTPGPNPRFAVRAYTKKFEPGSCPMPGVAGCVGYSNDSWDVALKNAIEVAAVLRPRRGGVR